MQNFPVITVYITSYNRPAMLARAIESVISQGFEDWELIIIDDASNKDVVSILDKYAAIESRINYLRNDKQSGANFNRNLAISKAQGKFITGLDDDDYFKPNRLQFFIDNYDSKYAFICDNRDVLEKDGSTSQSYKNREQKVSLAQIMKANVCGNQVFAETARLRGVGGFDLNIKKFQDHDTWISLIAKYGDAYRFNECSYVVDVRHEQQRISSSENTYDATLALYQKHKHLYSSYSESETRLKIMNFKGHQSLKLKAKDFLFFPLQSLKAFKKTTLTRSQ
ncbi:glycosyltransferase [Agarivorans sp. DSG3-1]|uniref:glycosyltransferase n=1 Tax=Agarivorans sp. DSG3-1 TaxID=3342249 RepID=UPI00398ED8C7